MTAAPAENGHGHGGADASPPEKRRRLAVGPAPVLGREEYLAKLAKVLEPMVNISAMYNSLVGGIVKDRELMCIPIHDHAIVRGHAVFDTCTLVAGRLYRLDIHLDRHIASAQRARIPLPFGCAGPEECKAKMREAVAQTVLASGLSDANVRYYTSVGPGNFGVVPTGCTSAFYVVVLKVAPFAVAATELLTGVREFTVDVPLKPTILATTKSNNYMLNAMTAMASQDKGGRYGVLVDPAGCIAESCVLNCVFVTRDKRLITPEFDGILAGTTARKILQLAQQLVADGTLSAVSQERIPLAVAKDCVEMFFSGGDSHIVPVTHWDDVIVGTGEVGEVTKHIAALIKKDMIQGEEDHYEVCSLE